jgi:RNA polymerase sigma factor (sigma-70 family)
MDMVGGHQGAVARDLEQVFGRGTGSGLSEGQLLGRFVAGRDEGAFATLVSRHGPMVLGVCRRVLGAESDAEDASQATFLVLVRRAGMLREAESLGPWLHGVARRVASRARADRARRRAQEEKAAIGRDEARPGGPGVGSQAETRELRAMLDEEIDRLPEKYRRPVVLCYLEGLTHEAAARRLRCQAGVLRGRLERARVRLRDRLIRRGVAPAAIGSMAVVERLGQPAQAAVSPALLGATLATAGRDVTVGKVAGAVAVSSAVELAGDFLRRQLLARCTAAAVLLAAGTLAVAALSRLGDEPSAARAAATITNQSRFKDSKIRESGPGEAPLRDGGDFELRVVGPGGEPVAEALVEVRTSAAPTADQVRRGRFLRPSTYGPYLATDGQGRLVIAFPKVPRSLDINITTPGYGPYWAAWSSQDHPDTIPSRCAAELEPGWSVGGVVVDSAGKPVAGAAIRPWIRFKKRPGDVKDLYAGSDLKTDATGKWRFESVPDSLGEVHLEIDHAGFRPLRRPLTRAEFGLEHGREPSARIVLDHGLTVTGRVTDEAGRPIAGALVRTKFLNDIREATTNGEGVYTLAGCEPRTAKIVVSARSRATDMKELRIDPDMGPVDFRMQPGGKVRVRVVDEQGRPVPRARIFFQWWRGPYSYFEFNHVGQYADKDGVWVWDEAPRDEFKADICPPDGMELLQQPLIARDEEYVFRTHKPLVVSGKVIDAATKQPVKEFLVVPGIRWDANHMNWARGESLRAADGQFEYRPRRGELAHLVRIEADGYEVAVSREIRSTEGDVALEFELKRANNLIAKVVTPDLKPAAGASVAIGVVGSQINVKNGRIDDGSTYAPRASTDTAGRFHFPPQEKDFQLVITHDAGYAHIKSPRVWDTARIIRLEPWARVEGAFRVGRTPTANVPINLQVLGRDSYGNDVPSVFTDHQVTTGPDGRFVFDRVIPGKSRIGRGITFLVDDGSTEVTSSCKVLADFPAGKTVHIDLGGTGRAVIGRLQPPEGVGQPVRWNFATISARAERDEDRETGPYLTATADREGRFRIDDVPPGAYLLDVRFDRDGAGHLWNRRFDVPKSEGPAIDLGTLKLEKR